MVPVTTAPAEASMSVMEFFEYLASRDCTADLAFALADLWAAHEVNDAFAA